MAGTVRRKLAIAMALLAVLEAGVAAGVAAAPNEAVILTINDVYRLKGISEGKLGGLHRLRSLRAQLEQDAPDLLLLHAGDIISPSFVGRIYRGAQMIDMLNVMDGDPRIGRFDKRMFAAFGNHEFDDTNCADKGPLAGLVRNSEFTWLGGNLNFTARNCEPLNPLAALHGPMADFTDPDKRYRERIFDTALVTSGGLRIGLYGLLLKGNDYAPIYRDAFAESCRMLAELRARKADVIIALTHMNLEDDLRLLGLGSDVRPLPKDELPCRYQPDLIVGGHEHHNIATPVDAPRIFKADSDARSAWVLRVKKAPDGTVSIRSELHTLDESVPADPIAERLANQWLRHNDERFCLQDCRGRTGELLAKCLAAIEDGACLKRDIALAVDEVETEEYANRSLETGFGDWLADRLREAGGSDVAFMNSGGIRLNHTIPAGTMITRRHLEEMFPFQNKLAAREVPGAQLWQAVQHAVSSRGEGPWAHFSGMAVRLHRAGGKTVVKQMAVKRRDGTVVEIGPDSQEMFSIASVPFALAGLDGHGFKVCGDEPDKKKCLSMIDDATGWPLGGDSAELSSFVRMQLEALGSDPGLRLARDRRLCEVADRNCLIDDWLHGQ